MGIDEADVQIAEPSSAAAERHRSSSPSRKRARLDDDEEVIQELQPHVPCEGDVIRDETYYFSDGSCILRVEGTLFNVHRTILCKDSSSFSAMFDLPVPQDEQVELEGTSDENPIVLSGDMAAQFKNFLWALYALPYELMTVYSDSADLTQLMDIAHIANKYSFRALETWALDALNDCMQRRPEAVFMSSAAGAKALAASGLHITRLVRLAQRCGHARLLGALVQQLKQRMAAQIAYAFLAMTLADDLGLRALCGTAYMEVLHKGMRFVMDAAARHTPDGDEWPAVSPAQLLRLLSGYHRLTQKWEAFRVQPLQFEHAPTCGATWHQHGCTQSWLDFWKEKSRCESVLALGLADVQGRLKQMVKEFERWGSATYMHHDCRMSAKKMLMDEIKELEEALPDFFVD